MLNVLTNIKRLPKFVSFLFSMVTILTGIFIVVLGAVTIENSNRSFLAGIAIAILGMFIVMFGCIVTASENIIIPGKKKEKKKQKALSGTMVTIKGTAKNSKNIPLLRT